MKFTPLEIPDVILIEPRVFRDNRGFFLETHNEDQFAEQGIGTRFYQDNHSCSGTGVLRGLHFQITPFAQAKLVRVVRGEVFDVAVDLRKGSPTFGKHVGRTLSEDNLNMLYIPPGFAHGFLVTKGPAGFLYKASTPYSPEHERGILWNDPALGIEWPAVSIGPVLSEKDAVYPTLKDYLAEEGS